MIQSIANFIRGVQRRARVGIPPWVGWSIQRLRQAICGPVHVGVGLQPEGWHVVLHAPGQSQRPSGHPSAGSTACIAAQHRAWSPPNRPDLMAWQPGRLHASVHGDHLAAWREALQALRNIVPRGVVHLTLAWPDELLWSGSITLTGPLSDAEVPTLLEQELSLLLPVPLDQVAWDARPLQNPLALASGPGGWHSRLSWLRARAGLASQWTESGQSDRDAVWQCWAIPRALAQDIAAVARQIGWASLGIEPRSVSWQRATALGSSWPDTMQAQGSMGADPCPEALAAWGAARRRPGRRPDLLRQHRGSWLARGEFYVQGRWPGWLVVGLVAGAGYALGGVQLERWAREQEVWTQRVRQLHATMQAHQTSRQAFEQDRRRQEEHQARVTHNQRFAQILQGWAATVPAGLRWQQLSMRPRFIELQGQASAAEGLSRWMDQWPQSLPAGGQHQVHWQPEAPGAQPAQSPAVWGLRVQLTWHPLQKATE